ncbi:MAG: DUF5989 family protein [Pseudomonadota bacterium]
MSPDPSSEFEKAANQPRTGFASEILAFLKETRKWWLLPIIIIFVLFGLFVLFGSSAAPFIYTLF